MDRRAFLRALAAAGALPIIGPAGRADASDRGSGRRVVVLGAGLAGLGRRAPARPARLRGDRARGPGAPRRARADRPRPLPARRPCRARRRPHLRVPRAHARLRQGAGARAGALRHRDAGVPHAGPALRGRPPPGSRGRWPASRPASSRTRSRASRSTCCPGFEALGDVHDPGWPGSVPSALELDRTTLADYMRAQGASETWLDWFFAQEGRIGRVNAAAGFAVEAISGGAELRSIRGGNDRLPKALAAALGERVRYRSEVVRIDERRGRVTVGYRDRGRLHELEADHCVCALPFAPLRRVCIDAPFSDAQAGGDRAAAVHGRRPLLLPDAIAVLGARPARAAGRPQPRRHRHDGRTGLEHQLPAARPGAGDGPRLHVRHRGARVRLARPAPRRRHAPALPAAAARHGR